MTANSDKPWFRKKACKNCPFKHKNRIFRYMERVEEMAELSENPYSFFHCHETGTTDDEGDFVPTEKSLECAGLLSMKVRSGIIDAPKGFAELPESFEDYHHMIGAYEDDDTPRLSDKE